MGSHFPALGPGALARPILFTTFLSAEYGSVDREELRKHVQGKLKVFSTMRHRWLGMGHLVTPLPK